MCVCTPLRCYHLTGEHSHASEQRVRTSKIICLSSDTYLSRHSEGCHWTGWYYTICRIKKSRDLFPLLHICCAIKTSDVTFTSVLLFWQNETMNICCLNGSECDFVSHQTTWYNCIGISIINYSIPRDFWWFKNNRLNWI